MSSSLSAFFTYRIMRPYIKGGNIMTTLVLIGLIALLIGVIAVAIGLIGLVVSIVGPILGTLAAIGAAIIATVIIVKAVADILSKWNNKRNS